MKRPPIGKRLARVLCFLLRRHDWADEYDSDRAATGSFCRRCWAEF